MKIITQLKAVDTMDGSYHDRAQRDRVQGLAPDEEQRASEDQRRTGREMVNKKSDLAIINSILVTEERQGLIGKACL
ncbi:12173_t:CDS:2 [Acaulospora colombiana]|uniref:12173_t:CDS:1 n=1 Tax=Acaulospora colombiana TaxID=27376 RepID=A0ACA9M8L7_9GLOM|nr:12173_t:CDS:2 [Acaulospora colombiana]